MEGRSMVGGRKMSREQHGDSFMYPHPILTSLVVANFVNLLHNQEIIKSQTVQHSQKLLIFRQLSLFESVIDTKKWLQTSHGNWQNACCVIYLLAYTGGLLAISQTQCIKWFDFYRGSTLIYRGITMHFVPIAIVTMQLSKQDVHATARKSWIRHCTLTQ